MRKKKEDGDAIPEQYKGNKLNVEYTVIASSIKEAVVIFSESVKRMLYVNGWQELSNSLLSHFQLTDEKGNELDRSAKEGDLFKIDIPGPGNEAGDGFDWVRVEVIIFKINRVAMRVRPVVSPTHPKNGTAHFFTRDATSTFQIFRRGRIVTAGVYSRNEIPNTDASDVIEKIRNTAVAIGAIAGASRVQWESLVHGFVHGKEVEAH
jgi:hypothetical protein